MQQEHYGPLRDRLSEVYAGRRLSGEQGLTSAGRQLLRRVLNLEALSAPATAACCDWGAAARELDAALDEALFRPRGWFLGEYAQTPLPVGLAPAPASQIVLDLIWLLAQTAPARLRLSLSARQGAAVLRLTAEGGLTECCPFPCGPGIRQSSLSDRELALAAAQALARRAGGTLLLYAAPGGPGAFCCLPLREGRLLAPVPARELLCDRFGPLHILLDGMTILPDAGS